MIAKTGNWVQRGFTRTKLAGEDRSRNIDDRQAESEFIVFGHHTDHVNNRVRALLRCLEALGHLDPQPFIGCLQLGDSLLGVTIQWTDRPYSVPQRQAFFQEITKTNP
ncbi:MAG: hypothetical protein ABGZ35_27735 [Planctomycetaceae bacterium]